MVISCVTVGVITRAVMTGAGVSVADAVSLAEVQDKSVLAAAW